MALIPTAKQPRWGKVLYAFKFVFGLFNLSGCLIVSVALHPRSWSSFLTVILASTLASLFLPLIHLEHFESRRSSLTLGFITFCLAFLQAFRIRSYVIIGLYHQYPGHCLWLLPCLCGDSDPILS